MRWPDLGDQPTREILQLLLGVYGASLASILAVIDIRARLRDRAKLMVWPTATADGLVVDIVNGGSRPITITGVELWYNDEWFMHQLVWESREQHTLEESRRVVVECTRDQIRAAVTSRRVTQTYDCRLSVKVKTSARSHVVELVLMDEAMLPTGFSRKAATFIATDQFLGFAQMEPKPSGRGIRSLIK